MNKKYKYLYLCPNCMEFRASSNNQINFFNNGLLLFSSHDPLTAEETVHFALAASCNPENVLLIGGGASEITQEILKHPVRNIDYIELDPLIVDFSKKAYIMI